MTLRALWGAAWNDIWAGGDALLHFDGTAWSLATAPVRPGETVRALAGRASNDVWAGGDVLRHFDGRTWRDAPGLPAGEVIALANSPAGVLAVLDEGDGPEERMSVVEGTAGAFSTVVAPTLPDLRALWVAPGPSGEAWVAGYDPARGTARLLHRAAVGQPFTLVPAPADGALVALWGSGARDVWAGGPGLLLHWDGASWTKAPGIDAGAEIRALWGSDPSDVYATTRGGALHWDGVRWSTLLPPEVGDPRLVRSVWGADARNVWMAGDTGLLWQGDRGTLTALSPGPQTFLEAVTGTGPSDAWAVGGGGTALHWNGTEWIPVATGVGDPIQAVWAASPTDVWAAGAAGDCTGFLLHWDGTRWSEVLGEAAGLCFAGLSGTGSANVWAVARGALLHWTGQKWQAEGPADVAGSVLAVGAEVFVLQDSTQGGPNAPGGVYHLAAGSWTLEQTGATASLRTLWGATPAEVWAAGDDATAVWRRPGSGAWTSTATGLDQAVAGLGSLWGSSPTDVYAASRGAPLLLRWDGARWSDLSVALGFSSLTGLGGTAAGELWAVGGDGTILHRTP